jgi:hypothetical protein
MLVSANFCVCQLQSLAEIVPILTLAEIVPTSISGKNHANFNLCTICARDF